MTLEKLKQYNGKNNQKAYIAYKGNIYDVTNSPLWKNGTHQNMHEAGVDLTNVLANAPHGEEVFGKFEIVDTLDEEDENDRNNVSTIDWVQWYRKYHPHPMLVHFPIALHLFASGLDLIFLFQPSASFATAVFYTFFVSTVMGIFTMFSGILSWWINYQLALNHILVKKLIFSVTTLILGIIGIIIYLNDPGVVYLTTLPSIFYHGIIFLTGITVIILGYYGGKLTWPNSTEDTRKDIKDDTIDDSKEEMKKETISPTMKEMNIPFQSVISKSPVSLPQNEEVNIDGKSHSISILIGGAAGTGIKTLENILSAAFKRSGYFVFSTKEYMSRVRGGSNTTLLRISDRPIIAPCWYVDLFIALDTPALSHVQERLTEDSVVLADENVEHEQIQITSIPMNHTAKELGSKNYVNSYAAGVLFGILNLASQPLSGSISRLFDEEDLQGNERAMEAGLTYGNNLETFPSLQLPKTLFDSADSMHLMDGSSASGFGFLAGGCNMITAYPMSPSTGVLNFMASMSNEFTLLVEQSEDEIASLNMVLGGWYGGARAMTSTSGGGFALMSEAISLSGMSETPAVVYLAQRPGPATGLPTRTEQGDLNLAIYSGHGYFGRIVLAPGDLQECIDYGYLAFELSDRYQMPVIYMSDQYLADSLSLLKTVDFEAYEQRRYIQPTDASYDRYRLSDTGISARGVPGVGEGIVVTTSDEHDERGQITESYHVREKMVQKRQKKIELSISEAFAPKVYGEGEIAIIGWGSTKGAIMEAINALDDPRLFHVHFSWVHPLNLEHLAFLKQTSLNIVIENNVTGEFAAILKSHDIKIDHRILQSNGFSFFTDRLKEVLEKVLEETT
ncbi:2-oxoacid:acceptor oxidoreductase subunit alpha [Sulfurovum sp. AR]|uniref:2-oxoacid:acceptor oxidoreductase subunit alpha n=1 Tax=Sulfurovum sp. AR TaxID=1165841 RepID=UPI00025C49D4|nr:2-oxoacid:acceptor oxidoreductase subunit alpha [Sulfurovum sp. AR]EIF51797.1 pyruvate flavodoxin/ferredoxin oxidoreductase domain-containing protein [Sulfurovum sp. AR]